MSCTRTVLVKVKKYDDRRPGQVWPVRTFLAASRVHVMRIGPWSEAIPVPTYLGRKVGA